MNLQRIVVLSSLLFIVLGTGLLYQNANDLIMESKVRNHISQNGQAVVGNDVITEESLIARTDMMRFSQEPKETVAIIVEHNLYSSVFAAVDQYRQDLNNSGYYTLLYTEVLSTAEELKGNLTQWYVSDNLIGAVLVGRLPYAEFHHDAIGDFSASTFICDLFLMDLDGIWTDTNPADGVYDGHSAISYVSDIYPEIFIGRIDPTCLTWKINVSSEVSKYLARIHDYRTGGVQRARHALVYVDDDWAGLQPWGGIWAADVGLSYSNRTAVLDPSWTNASDWLTNRILQDYQWGHLCAHSDATHHAFGPGGYGTEGTVSSLQIHSAPPSFNFYNLFCCSGALWTSDDNLAVTYTFSGNYSLASIGSSKTGSMMDCEYFYGALSENHTLGESLVEWFTRSLNNNGEAGGYYLEWYYGMNIVGDPLLSIYFDTTVMQPQVYSPTHPDEDSWYADNRPQFNWTEPPDVNGIEGYYYILDQNPITAPSPELANFTTSTGVSTSKGLQDGIWYLHVAAKDSVGNIGNATHYRVKIDTTPPSWVVLYPNKEFIGTGTFVISWVLQDTTSGYARAKVWVDSEEQVVYNGSSDSVVLQYLSEGQHVVNITVYDPAANSRSTQRTYFIDLTNPTLSIVKPISNIQNEQSIELEWSVNDTGSGYRMAEVVVNNGDPIFVLAPTTAITISDLDWGIYILDLTVYDWANRTNSVELEITIRPEYPEYLPPAMIGVGFIVIAVLLIALMKKG